MSRLTAVTKDLLLAATLLAGICSACRGTSPEAPQKRAAAPSPAPSPLPPGEYGAALVESNRVRFASWQVAPDGTIAATPFDRDCHCCYQGPDAPKPTSKVVFKPGPARGWPTAPPQSDAATAVMSWPAMRGRLTLPGRPPAAAWLQWYGYELRGREYAVFRPDRGGQPWAVVLMTTCRSPEGAWDAPAVGDLDGDGELDLAFVAHGVGTCGGEGTPDCPLVWLDISLSSTHTVYPRRGGEVLLRNADVAQLERRIGTELHDESIRWQGQIAPGRYDVTLTGRSGTQVWTARLLDGTLRVAQRN
jgi:hypothetical protein